MDSRPGWRQWCRHLCTLWQRSLYVMALGGTTILAHAQGSADFVDSAARGTGASTRYDVVELGAGSAAPIPLINATGQVAYSMSVSLNVSKAFFYDGSSIRDMGTLGGSQSFAAAINDAGQITGFSYLAGDQVLHAYRWSAQTGMIDLGVPSGGADSEGYALNSRGDVAGRWNTTTASFPFRWSASRGITDLAQADYTSMEARAIDDTGMVAGHGFTNLFTRHVLVWPRKGAVIDIGHLGGGSAEVIGVSAQGQVMGNSSLANGLNRAYVWTRGNGIQDLGAAGGIESLARVGSTNGRVVGLIRFSSENGSVVHGFLWTPRVGMVDIGTLNGINSIALGVNNKGQVVGWSSDEQVQKAILWSASDGMVDLGSRLHNAPAGLVLQTAIAISDCGDILATSNAGLLLLKPRSATHVH